MYVVTDLRTRNVA